MSIKVKIDDHIEAFVDFEFGQSSECTTGFVETLGGPIDVDNWSSYGYLENFTIAKVLIDGVEVDYKTLSKDKVEYIESKVSEIGDSMAEDMEMESDYCEEPDYDYTQDYDPSWGNYPY